MTSAEKLEILKKWQATVTKVDETCDALQNVLKLDIESPLMTLNYDLEYAYTTAVAQLVGDEGDWLNWYRWDNDMGRKGHSCWYPTSEGKIEVAVHTIEDLLRVMEANK